MMLDLVVAFGVSFGTAGVGYFSGYVTGRARGHREGLAEAHELTKKVHRSWKEAQIAALFGFPGPLNALLGIEDGPKEIVPQTEWKFRSKWHEARNKESNT